MNAYKIPSSPLWGILWGAAMIIVGIKVFNADLLTDINLIKVSSLLWLVMGFYYIVDAILSSISRILYREIEQRKKKYLKPK